MRLLKNYESLVYAIVTQAVIDYRKCRKKGKPVAHLVRFFNSEWCDTLLSCSSINGKMILEKLKSESYAKVKRVYKKAIDC